MNRTTTQRGLAAAALLGLLAALSACGTQTGVAEDPAVQQGLGQHPQGRAQGPGQSDRALKADALRAAQGQLPAATASPSRSAKRVTDSMP
jgi:hypothetical protein